VAPVVAAVRAHDGPAIDTCRANKTLLFSPDQHTPSKQTFFRDYMMLVAVVMV
jgi:hypothetical protein